MRYFVALILFALGALNACDPGRHYGPLDSNGRYFRDADGRAVILRGINARVTGIYDGRPPDQFPTFADADAARMSELGFNLVRLPVSWSAFEPQPGVYSSPYLDRVAQVVDLCHAHGLYVLIDMHQDGWSKVIGDDGAPDWAIVPPPPPNFVPSGPTSGPVQSASSAFFTDDAVPTSGGLPLQEHFAQMMQKLATRFVGNAGVLGYELFNEPLATDYELPPFHAKVAKAIRQVDQAHLIAFEPSVTRNFTGSTVLTNAPFPVGGAVYAPHIYTAVFSDPRLAADTYETALHSSVRAARDEADAWGTPLLIGEFGAGPTQPNATSWIGHALDDADEVLASTTFWLWKEESSGHWGLFDVSPDGSTWTERPLMIAAVARPYVRAIGGDPTSVRWDGTALALSFTGRGGVKASHEAFFPFPVSSVSCDGAPVSFIAEGGSMISATCGGAGAHTLALVVSR